MRTTAVMRTFGIIALGVIWGGFAASQASAQTADFDVKATVTKNCTITATPVQFQDYDPVVAHATAAATGTGNISVACTKGVASAKVALSNGGHYDSTASVRQMASGGEMLAYELLTPDNTAWTSGTGSYQIPTSIGRAARNFAVNGRIPGGQDVPTGSYSDAIVATVNF
jgi:spore coat protein U-like protein